MASASWFFTSRPWTISRTASSVILPDLVRGISLHREDHGGHMAGRGAIAHLLLDQGDQLVIQGDARRQPHKENNAHVIVPVLADGQGLKHLGDALDLGIDFSGADAHAAGIERGIGTAMNDEAAMGGDLGEIAVAPDIVKAGEIGVVIFLAIGIIPEHDGHGGKRLGANQFALFLFHRMAVVIQHIHGHAEHRPLDFAAPDAGQRIAADEAAADIGAAGNGGEMDIGLYRVIDKIEILGAQRRAGGHHGAKVCELVGVAGAPAGLAHGIDIFGGGSENRHVRRVGKIKQRAFIGMERRAVIEQQGGACGQAAHQPVPHHPAAGGEIEEAVARLHIAVQDNLTEVLQQNAAGAVDDAFGNAGGSGGIENIERMIEGHLGESNGRFAFAGAEGVKGFRLGQLRGHGFGLPGVIDHHGLFDAWQLGQNLGDFFGEAVGFSGIEIGIAGEQELGGNLAEAVENAALAEIRRAG